MYFVRVFRKNRLKLSPPDTGLISAPNQQQQKTPHAQPRAAGPDETVAARHSLPLFHTQPG
jgi:hypothetical protein